MLFVSATRLKVKSLLYLPMFFAANEASVKQLRKTPGFAGGKELVDKHLVFWTLTAWENEAAMKGFRNSAPHRKAMQKLPDWCNEAAYVHWAQEANGLPGWQTVYEKLLNDGRLTKVRNLSPLQETKSYPPIRWTKVERNFEKFVSK